jgi:hypothetical protein
MSPAIGAPPGYQSAAVVKAAVAPFQHLTVIAMIPLDLAQGAFHDDHAREINLHAACGTSQPSSRSMSLTN